MEPKRSLTLAEFRRVIKQENTDLADVMAVSLSCEVPLEEAQAWFEKVPAGEGVRLIGKVFEISGLTEGARFQGGQGDDAVAERATG